MPSLGQDRIEAELLAILREIAMPLGLAEAVDAALATSMDTAEPKSRQASLRAYDARLERLRDLYMNSGTYPVRTASRKSRR